MLCCWSGGGGSRVDVSYGGMEAQWMIRDVAGMRHIKRNES